MPLTHEQRVEYGRRGGLSIKKGSRRRTGENDASLIIRLPPGLKEWYQRRADEHGVPLSQLIREILQNKRMTVSGNQRYDS